MRQNGWEKPFHCLQLATWIVFPLVISIFFAFYTPLLPRVTALIGSTVYGIMAVCMVAFASICTGKNPVDDRVLATEADMANAAVGDDHVFCNVCMRYVQKYSRHCRLCDKCVAVFDHHCKWLNNCVGKKNYSSFFSSITSAAILLGIQIGLGGYILWLCFSRSGDIERRSASAYGCSDWDPKDTQKCTADGYRLTLTAIKVIHSAFVALVGIAWLLIVQLFLFHLQLCYEKITTYDYIVRQRKRKLEREASRRNRCQDNPCAKAKKAKSSSFPARRGAATITNPDDLAMIHAEVDEEMEVRSSQSGSYRRTSSQDFCVDDEENILEDTSDDVQTNSSRSSFGPLPGASGSLPARGFGKIVLANATSSFVAAPASDLTIPPQRREEQQFAYETIRTPTSTSGPSSRSPGESASFSVEEDTNVPLEAMMSSDSSMVTYGKKSDVKSDRSSDLI